MRQLDEDVGKMVFGDKPIRSEMTLASQAHTLDAIFNRMARLAAVNMTPYPETGDVFLKLALRAQSQCRATLEALHNIKQPRQVAYVKQANIAAGDQHINNGEVVTAEKNVNPPNELLEHEDAERLDFGAAATPGRADKDMETVVAFHGTEERGRKS